MWVWLKLKPTAKGNHTQTSKSMPRMLCSFQKLDFFEVSVPAFFVKFFMHSPMRYLNGHWNIVTSRSKDTKWHQNLQSPLSETTSIPPGSFYTGQVFSIWTVPKPQSQVLEYFPRGTYSRVSNCSSSICSCWIPWSFLLVNRHLRESRNLASLQE